MPEHDRFPDHPRILECEGLLWSDPEKDLVGRRFNDMRNAGCRYGLNEVHGWLTELGLTYFVRSHECVPQGWEAICGVTFAVTRTPTA